MVRFQRMSCCPSLRLNKVVQCLANGWFLSGVDVRKLAVGHLNVGEFDAAIRRQAKGIAVDRFDFHFSSGAEIQHHRGRVGRHFVREFDHQVCKGVRYRASVGGRSGLDVGHQIAEQGTQNWIADHLVRCRIHEDAEAVVGNVPHQLAPATENQVVQRLVLDACVGEQAGQRLETRRETSGAEVWRVLANCDFAVVEVFDVPRSDLVRADEAESARHVVGSDNLGDVVVRPHAVLERKDKSSGGENMRKDVFEHVVLHGFERDNDEVAVWHVAKIRVDGRMRQIEVPADGLDGQSVLFYVGVVGMEKKMDVMSGGSQTGAVIAADGAGANDADSVEERVAILDVHGARVYQTLVY